MNRIAYLQKEMDECFTKALQTKDMYLKKFWYSAGLGFQMKMLEEEI